jgi:protein-disulfide isomerase
MANMTEPQPKQLSMILKNILLTGMVGWIASLYSQWHSAKVHAGVDIGEAFCNISEKVNCDTVALSRFSMVGPVPVPILGLAYFAIVTLLAMRALKQLREGSVGELTRKLLFFAGVVGVVTSLIFALISFTKIGALCLVCLVIYFLSFSNFYFSRKLYKASEGRTVKEKFSALVVLLYVVAALAQYAFYPLANFAATNGQMSGGAESVPAEILKEAKEDFSEASSFVIPEQNSPSFGATDAKVTVVEFSDFQCPHCAHNHEHMPPAIESFGGKVRMIYKNFPLDTACNSAGAHKNACYEAYAARCVFKKKGLSGFKAMQDYLFKSAETFSKEGVENFVSNDLGVTEADLRSCVDSTEIRQEIKDEIDLGKSLGIEGTPSIFVNGKLFKQGANTGILKAIIKDLLSKN